MNTDHSTASGPPAPQRLSVPGRLINDVGRHPSPETERPSRRASRPIVRTFGPALTDCSHLPPPPVRKPPRAPAPRGLPQAVTIHPAGPDRPGVEIRVRDALIAAAAREIWKQRGGNEVLNWLEAEVLVDDALSRLRASAPPHGSESPPPAAQSADRPVPPPSR